MRSTTTPTALGGPATHTDATRASGLFLVRESDQYDLELFNAMRELTYMPYRNIPVVEAVRQAALQPLTSEMFDLGVFGQDGQATGTETVRVEVIERGRTRALLFYCGGYWHLWSRSSAAKLTQSGVNEFTDILIEVIERVRPLNLYAANFSRLIRSQAQGHRLAAAMAGNVQRVCAGEVTFELEGPRSNVDMMMFSMFAMVASMERNWIVQRLLAGKVAKWRRGEWPFGKGAVPIGYMLDGKTQQLRPDPSQKDAVREMLLILCSDAPPSEMARQLSRIGIVSRRLSEQAGTRVPVAALRSADQHVKALYAWAGLWCHGEFVYRLSNVFGDVEELAGLRISRDPHRVDDAGELQMLYKVGVPDGGWAEPELLRAFAQKATQVVETLVNARERSRPRPLTAVVSAASAAPALHERLLGASALIDRQAQPAPAGAPARARQRIAPWTGRKWIDGDFVYELRAKDAARYAIVRWPVLRNLVRRFAAADPHETDVYDDVDDLDDTWDMALDGELL